MRVLVCGGRDYTNQSFLFKALDNLPVTPSIIIHGDCKTGADQLAKEWAISRGIHYAAVPALWTVYDRPAGNLRNSAMLLLQPELGVAFPGGSGTRDMIKKLKLAGISVWEFHA